MLLLSRKCGEELVIGNCIRVKVLEMQGDRVKLGFIAPAEITIHRKESPKVNGATLPVTVHAAP